MTATTRLSSKGQIVIPADVRRRLGWQPGQILTVEASDHALLLRPGMPDHLDDHLERGYAWFERSGQDPVKALHDHRQRARAQERRRR